LERVLITQYKLLPLPKQNVANEGGNTVLLIAIASNIVVATIRVENAPYAVVRTLRCEAICGRATLEVAGNAPG
jgi:hypothetical protein